MPHSVLLLLLLLLLHCVGAGAWVNTSWSKCLNS